MISYYIIVSYSIETGGIQQIVVMAKCQKWRDMELNTTLA